MSGRKPLALRGKGVPSSEKLRKQLLEIINRCIISDVLDIAYRLAPSIWKIGKF